MSDKCGICGSDNCDCDFGDGVGRAAPTAYCETCKKLVHPYYENYPTDRKTITVERCPHCKRDVRFNVARLIEWGYETGGDLDEAKRVYFECDGVITPNDPGLPAIFENEFEQE